MSKVSPSVVLRPAQSEELVRADSFPSKAHHMVEHCHKHDSLIACWSEDGNAFIVKDSQSLAMKYLPDYFKHSNFQSFVRQLNLYGFRSVRTKQGEDKGKPTAAPAQILFRHEFFQKGRRDLLHNIKRGKKGEQRALAAAAAAAAAAKGELVTSTEKKNGKNDGRFDRMEDRMNGEFRSLGDQMNQLSAKMDRLIILITSGQNDLGVNVSSHSKPRRDEVFHPPKRKRAHYEYDENPATTASSSSSTSSSASDIHEHDSENEIAAPSRNAHNRNQKYEQGPPANVPPESAHPSDVLERAQDPLSTSVPGSCDGSTTSDGLNIYMEMMMNDDVLNSVESLNGKNIIDDQSTTAASESKFARSANLIKSISSPDVFSRRQHDHDLFGPDPLNRIGTVPLQSEMLYRCIRPQAAGAANAEVMNNNLAMDRSLQVSQQADRNWTSTTYNESSPSNNRTRTRGPSEIGSFESIEPVPYHSLERNNPEPKTVSSSVPAFGSSEVPPIEAGRVTQVEGSARPDSTNSAIPVATAAPNDSPPLQEAIVVAETHHAKVGWRKHRLVIILGVCLSLTLLTTISSVVAHITRKRRHHDKKEEPNIKKKNKDDDDDDDEEEKVIVRPGAKNGPSGSGGRTKPRFGGGVNIVANPAANETNSTHENTNSFRQFDAFGVTTSPTISSASSSQIYPTTSEPKPLLSLVVDGQSYICRLPSN